MLLILLSSIVNIVVLTTRSLIFLYLTTIVTMVDNIINDTHASIGNVVCPIVEHCQHCRFNNKKLNNFVFNDNRDNGRPYF